MKTVYKETPKTVVCFFVAIPHTQDLNRELTPKTVLVQVPVLYSSRYTPKTVLYSSRYEYKYEHDYEYKDP